MKAKQRIKHGTETSDWTTINASVPQGTLSWGTCTFLLFYINELGGSLWASALNMVKIHICMNKAYNVSKVHKYVFMQSTLKALLAVSPYFLPTNHVSAIVCAINHICYTGMYN